MKTLLAAVLLLTACGKALPGESCTVTIGGQSYPGTILADGETCALLCQGHVCINGGTP